MIPITTNPYPGVGRGTERGGDERARSVLVVANKQSCEANKQLRITYFEFERKSYEEMHHGVHDIMM